MQTKVAIKKCNDYNIKILMQKIDELIKLLGGWSKFVKSSDKVLIKPNFLMDSKANDAIITHPNVIIAVINLLNDYGSQVFLGDSPGLCSLNKVLKISGLDRLLKKTNVKVLSFTSSVPVKYKDNLLFKDLKIAKEIYEIDRIINLPKLKTHIKMMMTLAVKNLFGCIVGIRKSQWHLKTGKKNEGFARLLLDVYQTVKPCLNIIDGITSMCGDGPANGTIINTEILAASSDAVALDTVIMKLLDIDPLSLLTIKIAKELGIGQSNLNNIHIVGDSFHNCKIKNFTLPKYKDICVGGRFEKYLKNIFTEKPVQNKKNCILCGECIKICPTSAIINKKDKLYFNYRKCISCFCCHEICKHNGIKIKTNLLHQLLGKLVFG